MPTRYARRRELAMSKHTPEHRCCGEVYDNLRWRSVQCKRSGVNEEGGKWYCKQHTPSLKKSAADARYAAWKAKYDADEARREHRDRCVNALRGLDVAKVEALLDAVRIVGSSAVGDKAYSHGLSLESKAMTDLENSIRAGGGQ